MPRRTSAAPSPSPRTRRATRKPAPGKAHARSGTLSFVAFGMSVAAAFAFWGYQSLTFWGN